MKVKVDKENIKKKSKKEIIPEHTEGEKFKMIYIKI